MTKIRANQAELEEILNDPKSGATESKKGTVEIATQTEVNAGTDLLKSITPNTLSTYVASELTGYEPVDATILRSADIGVTVQGYDATILNAADIGVTVAAQGHTHTGVYEPADSTILKAIITTPTTGHVLTYTAGGDWVNTGSIKIETDGTLVVTTASYENLVTANNDIPNKKYVDDAIGTGIGATTLGQLIDVNLGGSPALVNGHILTYDTSGSPAIWKNLPVITITDHTELSSIGTNTHAEIDTFISNVPSTYVAVAGDTMTGDLTMSGSPTASRILFLTSTALTPSITHNVDTNTGLYFDGNDLIGFTTGGTSRLVIESNGTLNVAGTTNYENLVTTDDDIPNKKYVDDAITIGGGAATLDALLDVSLTGSPAPQTGDVLTYSGTGSPVQWVHQPIPSKDLNDLTDVNLTGSPAPTINDVLTFDGNDWVHQGITATGAAGNDTEIQFNTGGSFDASSNLTFDGTTVDVTGQVTALHTANFLPALGGTNNAASGIAILGIAGGASASAVRGNSTSGRGVYGFASSTTAANFGVLGTSNSSAGYGGSFKNTNGDDTVVNIGAAADLIIGTNNAVETFRVTDAGVVTTSGGIDKLTTASGVVSVAGATAPTDGQVLTAVAGSPLITATWQTPNNVTSLDTLTDVAYGSPSPSEGDVLTYVAGSPPYWTNQAPAAGNNWLIADNGDNFLNAPAATGTNSIALGDNATTSTGTNSISIGTNASGATGSNSAVAIGHGALAADPFCVAIGYGATTPSSNGNYAIAVGRNSSASGSGIAIGSAAQSNYPTSIAIGRDAIAGVSNGDGRRCIAIGFGCEALAYAQTVMGRSVTASSTDTQESHAVKIGYGVTGADKNLLHLRNKGKLELVGDEAQFILPNYVGSPAALPATTIAGGLVYDTNAQGLMVNGGSPTGWIAVGGGASTLNELTDVDVAGSPAVSGQVLTFNGTSWVNATPAPAGETYVTINSTGTAPTATGADAIAIGENSTASNNFATSIGWTATSSANYATSIGYNATAGLAAVALGEGCTASGSRGVAVGNKSTATTDFSTSIGYSNIASQTYQQLLGTGLGAADTTTDVAYSSKIGYAEGSNPTHKNLLHLFSKGKLELYGDEAQFIIPNYTLASGSPGQYPANAIEGGLIYDSDNKELHIYGGSPTGWNVIGGGASTLNELTDVTLGSPVDNQVLTYSGGAWINAAPDTGNNWLIANNGADVSPAPTAAGANAIAIGKSSSAAGVNSIGIGQNANGGSYVGIAIGDTVTAGSVGVAIGAQITTTTGASAVAIGHSANASGARGVAVGNGATATANDAVGINASAGGISSTAIGDNSSASNLRSVAIGGATCNGTSTDSIAIGTGNNSFRQAQVSIGVNLDGNDVTTDVPYSTKIGYGTDDVNKNFLHLHSKGKLEIYGEEAQFVIPSHGSPATIAGEAGGLIYDSTISVLRVYGGSPADWQVVGSATELGGLSDVTLSGSPATLTDGHVLTWDDATSKWVDQVLPVGGEDYVVINSTGTLPTAVGTDAVSIGENAIAAGLNGVAVGKSANSTATASVAIGGAKSYGNGSVSLNGDARGNYSFSGTSRSRARGHDDIAIGQYAYTGLTSTRCIAIGRNTTMATAATDNVVIGQYNIATQNSQIILGNNITSADVTSDEPHSVRLGTGTADANKNMLHLFSKGKLELYGDEAQFIIPNYVLTGSPIAFPANANEGALIYDSTAKGLQVYGGSPAGWTVVGGSSNNWLTANNGSNFDVAPIATGSNSIALGNDATTAATTNSVAIGSTVSAQASGVVIGHSSTGIGDSVSIGHTATGNAAGSVSIGDTTTTTGINAVAIGNLAQATYKFGVAIGNGLTSYGGVGIGNNADAGYGSVSIGKNTTATQGSTVSIGYGNTAGTSFDVAIGRLSSTAASGGSSIAIGNNADTGGAQSIAMGINTTTAALTNQVAIGTECDAGTVTSDVAYSVKLGYASATANKNMLHLYSKGKLELYGDSAQFVLPNWINAGSPAVDLPETADKGGLIYDSTADGLLVYTGSPAGWTVVGGGITDHTLLSNIGTNTHAQIDTHISAISPHNNWIYANGGADFGTAPVAGGTTQGNIAIGDSANAGTTFYSVAIGQLAECTTHSSVALGRGSSVTTGTYGISVGNSTVTGSDGIAIGRSSTATGDQTVSIGFSPDATADDTIAIGSSSTAGHTLSTVLGKLNTSSQAGQVIIGNNLSSGTTNTDNIYSVKIGQGTGTYKNMIHVDDRGHFELYGTRAQIVVPKYPTASEPANPREGSLIYDSTLGALKTYDGGSPNGWNVVGGSGGLANPLTADLNTGGYDIITSPSTTAAYADDISLLPGANSYVGGSSYGGRIFLTGGAATNGNFGGYVSIAGGSSDTAAGGVIRITGGHSTGAGTGGYVKIQGGNSGTGTPGSLKLYGGVQSSGAGNGADVLIKAGYGRGATYTGGNIKLIPANGVSSATGGFVDVHSTFGSSGQASIRLWDDTNGAHTTGNYVELKVPAGIGSPAANWTLTLPPNNGDDGQVLTTDGTGITTWTTVATESYVDDKVEGYVAQTGNATNTDFSGNPVQSNTLTTNVSLTTSNRAAGQKVDVFYLASGADRTVTLNASWNSFGEASPIVVPSGKRLVLSLVALGTAETDVQAIAVLEN